MWKRCNRRLIPKAEERDLRESESTIRDPDRSSKKGDDNRMFGEIWAMQSNHDEDQHEHEDMSDVEDFVPEPTKEECCGEDDKHSESGDDSDDLGCLEEVFKLVAFVPGLDVDNCVEHGPEDRSIASYLMKDVDAFVGVGCQEGKWCVLQGEEGHKAEVGYCNPRRCQPKEGRGGVW